MPVAHVTKTVARAFARADLIINVLLHGMRQLYGMRLLYMFDRC